MAKILAAIHLYYHNQTDYLLEKLQSLKGFDFKLFVTYVEENKESFEKFKNFKNDTVFIKVNNAGYDIWPFIRILNSVDLNDFDYILKLHTKNCSENGDYCWRNSLIEPVIGTKKIFRNCIGIFEKNPKIGLIGAKSTIETMDIRFKENTNLWDETCNKLGISNKKGIFIAGTIFIVRANLMEAIKKLNLKEEDFYTEEMKTGQNGTVAHVIERLLSVTVERQGYKIYGSNQRKSFSKENLRKVFSLTNKDSFKILTVLGINFKFKRYKYRISGRKNMLVVFDDNEDKCDFLRAKKIEGLEIKINGNGNRIKIARNAKFKNVSIEITSSTNDITFYPNTYLENVIIKFPQGENKLLKIKENSKVQNREIVLNKENEELAI